MWESLIYSWLVLEAQGDLQLAFEVVVRGSLVDRALNLQDLMLPPGRQNQN